MVTDSFPSIENIRKVYESVCNFLMIPIGGGKESICSFRIEDFANKFHLRESLVYHSLKLLEREGYLEYVENIDGFSRIYFITGRDDLYKIQTERKDLEIFIKLILRSYSGVFSDYVTIDEELLCKRSGLSQDEVYQNLKTLSQLKIIHYIPKKKLPVISFEKERIEAKRVSISPENYQLRKVQYQLQVDSVISYASGKEECRSRSLLRYFGQSYSESCGTCDVCKGDHQTGMSFSEFSKLSEKIKKVIFSGNMTINEIVHQMNESEKKVIVVSRWMLDKDIIKSDQGGILSVI